MFHFPDFVFHFLRDPMFHFPRIRRSTSSDARTYHSGESIATSRRAVTELKARGLVEPHFTKSGREGIKLTDLGWNFDPEAPPRTVEPAPAPPVSVVVVGSNTGTIMSASPHSHQSVQVAGAVDVRGITQALKVIAVPDDEVEALRVAVEDDSRTGPVPGSQCKSWLHRAGEAVASGAWSLAKGATIATIRDAVRSHLGGTAG